MNKAKLLLPLLLGAALPALAQTPANPPVSDPYARGYTAPHSPDAPAVNAVQGPVTDALNSQGATQSGAQVALNDAQKAQYDKDMSDYRAKVEANARQNMRDQAHFDNQQRAYADAMFAWRLQTRACERGHVKACRAPTPDPADYY
jgi:hypothetical protein